MVALSSSDLESHVNRDRMRARQSANYTWRKIAISVLYTLFTPARMKGDVWCLLEQKRVSCSRHDSVPQFVLMSNLTVGPVFRFPACYFCETAELFQPPCAPSSCFSVGGSHIPAPTSPTTPLAACIPPPPPPSSHSPHPTTTTTKLPLVARCHGSWLERTAPFSPSRCHSIFCRAKNKAVHATTSTGNERGAEFKKKILLEQPDSRAGGGGV